MKRTGIYLIGILFAFLAACSASPTVNTEELSDADFGEYQTYAYLPSGDSAEYQTIMEERVIREVDQQMQARGYEIDTENPDLLVLVKTMFEQEERLERAPIGTAYNYYSPGFYAARPLDPVYYTNYAAIPRITARSGIREVEYTEGTFVVDIIDASNNQIIWRGWSETPVDRNDLDSSIRDYIANIFEEYPVETAGQ